MAAPPLSSLTRAHPLSVDSEFSRRFRPEEGIRSSRQRRSPRTRNGDMNIPAVEYRRVVNPFVRDEDEGRRLGSVLGAEATLFSRLERILDARALAKFFVLINVNAPLPTLRSVFSLRRVRRHGMSCVYTSVLLVNITAPPRNTRRDSFLPPCRLTALVCVFDHVHASFVRAKSARFESTWNGITSFEIPINARKS